jgi:endonuclease/exonuclease/phosphatase family metal-dependent hydrolase
MACAAWLVAVIAVTVLLFFFWRSRVRRSIRRYTEREVAEYCPDRQKQYNVLEYNVSWTGPYAASRMVDFADQIDHYDFLILQGAYQSSGLVTDFLGRAKSKGFNWVVSGHAPALLSLQTKDAGLLILSKLPIQISDAIAFKKGKPLSGVVYAKARISAFEFTHLLATELDSDQAIRNEQLAEVVALAKAHITDRFPVFLGAGLGVNALAGSGYDEVKSALALPKREVVDIIAAETGVHPLTYGEDGEIVLTPLEDRGSKQSVDFLLYFKPPIDWIVDKFVAKVEKFAIIGKPYGSLSSHFGISADVHIKESDLYFEETRPDFIKT